MASKYSQKFPIPQGFPEILHDFTREVLRDQPEDIIEYATLYFESLHNKKPFHYESKYNVKPDQPQKSHYLPKEKTEFDPANPPVKQKPVAQEKEKVTDTSHSKSMISQGTSHKEEKAVAKEYIADLGEGILDQVSSQQDAELGSEDRLGTDTAREEEGKQSETPRDQFKYFCSDLSPLCFPVTYLLARYDIPYAKVEVDPREETDRPAPVIEDGDQEVVGTTNCLLYICKKFEIEDTICQNIMADDNDIEQFLRFFATYEPVLDSIRKAIEEGTGLEEEMIETLDTFLQQVEENVLANRPFLASEEDISLADITVIGYLATLLTTAVDLKKYPRVEAWIKSTLTSDIQEPFNQFFTTYRQAFELEGENEILAELSA